MLRCVQGLARHGQAFAVCHQLRTDRFKAQVVFSEGCLARRTVVERGILAKNRIAALHGIELL